jgi:hypothetical protein
VYGLVVPLQGFLQVQGVWEGVGEELALFSFKQRRKLSLGVKKAMVNIVTVGTRKSATAPINAGSVHLGSPLGNITKAAMPTSAIMPKSYISID